MVIGGRVCCIAVKRRVIFLYLVRQWFAPAAATSIIPAYAAHQKWNISKPSWNEWWSMFFFHLRDESKQKQLLYSLGEICKLTLLYLRPPPSSLLFESFLSGDYYSIYTLLSTACKQAWCNLGMASACSRSDHTIRGSLSPVYLPQHKFYNVLPF